LGIRRGSGPEEKRERMLCGGSHEDAVCLAIREFRERRVDSGDGQWQEGVENLVFRSVKSRRKHFVKWKFGLQGIMLLIHSELVSKRSRSFIAYIRMQA
jgi:hypothetical protein